MHVTKKVFAKCCADMCALPWLPCCGWLCYSVSTGLRLLLFCFTLCCTVAWYVVHFRWCCSLCVQMSAFSQSWICKLFVQTNWQYYVAPCKHSVVWRAEGRSYVRSVGPWKGPTGSYDWCLQDTWSLTWQQSWQNYVWYSIGETVDIAHKTYGQYLETTCFSLSWT